MWQILPMPMHTGNMYRAMEKGLFLCSQCISSDRVVYPLWVLSHQRSAAYQLSKPIINSGRSTNEALFRP